MEDLLGGRPMSLLAIVPHAASQTLPRKLTLQSAPLHLPLPAHPPRPRAPAASGAVVQW